MTSFATLYAAVLAAGIVLGVIVLVAAWRNRPRTGATSLALLMGGLVVWLASDLASVLVADPGATLLAVKVSYFGLPVVVAAFVAFATVYTGREELLTRRTAALLAIEPAAVVVLVWTNGAHRLFWTRVEPAAGAVVGLEFTFGPAFWVHAAYSYFLLLVGTLMVLELLYRSQHVYQRQALAVLGGVTVPWIASVMNLTGATAVDLTPGGLTVTGVTFGWAMFRADFIDVTPVARNAVVDGISHGVFVLDPEDRFIDINPTGRRMLGVEDEDVIGRNVREVLDGVPELVARYEQVVEADDELQVETDDGHRYYEVEVSPQHDSRGRLVGRLFLVRDVTDRRERERELRHKNRQLDRFASVVSHDLRNPLAVAQGHIELARETGDLDALEVAHEATERMDRLTGHLLELSREGEAVEPDETVDLAALTRRAWSHVDTRGASLVVDSELRIVADSEQLLRALENLLSNAVEHAGPGVTVTVGDLPADDGSDDPVGFFVGDDGPGIPESRREEVLSPGVTTDDGGTGLGLAIVEAIAMSHGWTVEVNESADGGARFEVTGVEPVPASDPPAGDR